jgi:hypothetical protein
MGNYSRFIRPGMKRIEIQRSDGATDENTVDDLMVSSYYDEPSGVVVTVFVNYHAHKPKLVQLNYQNIPANKVIDSIVPYVTSSTGNLTAYGELSPGETITIPKKSIVTLVSAHSSPSASILILARIFIAPPGRNCESIFAQSPSIFSSQDWSN